MTIAVERNISDDAIMPRSTRKRIARAPAMLKNKQLDVSKMHDNIPL